MSLLIAELGGDTSRPFDGLAPGLWYDMYGRKIELKSQDFPTIVENTNRAIESTRGESGEIVGLPIDQRNHEKGEAAGWIVAAELSGEGEIIKLTPRWNELGTNLISKKIFRGFSATFDPSEKVVLGGSLVNWPALTKPDGTRALRPIELSQQLYAVDDVTDQKETEEEIMSDQNISELVSAAVAEFLQGDTLAGTIQEQVEKSFAAIAKPVATAEIAADEQPDILEFLEMKGVSDDIAEALKDQLFQQHELMKKRAQREAMQMINKIRREERTADFAAASVTGSEDAPRGIPTDASKLQEWLLSLNQVQYEFATGLIESIRKNGLVEFSEIGKNGVAKGSKQVPAEFVSLLDDGSATISEVIAFAGIVDPEEYDFSSWK